MQQLTIPPSTSNTQTQKFSLNDFFDESEISKKSNISIFELTGDKNDNGIVDFADFSNEDEAKLFTDKGLIGKNWGYVRAYIGKLLNKESCKIKIPNHNPEMKNAYYEITTDQNGKVVSQVFYAAKSLNGKPYCEEKTYSYDEQGNITSYKRKLKTSPYKEHEVNFKNKFHKNGNLSTRTLVLKPTSLSGEILYFDEDGNLTKYESNIAGANRSTDYFGNVEYTHKEYSRNDNGGYCVYSDERIGTNNPKINKFEFKTYYPQNGLVTSFKGVNKQK